MRDNLADHPHYAVQIPLYGFVPGRVIEFFQPAQRGSTVIIHQNIDSSEPLNGSLDNPHAVIRPSDVTGNGEDGGPGIGANLFGGSVEWDATG